MSLRNFLLIPLFALGIVTAYGIWVYTSKIGEGSWFASAASGVALGFLAAGLIVVLSFLVFVVVIFSGNKRAGAAPDVYLYCAVVTASVLIIGGRFAHSTAVTAARPAYTQYDFESVRKSFKESDMTASGYDLTWSQSSVKGKPGWIGVGNDFCVELCDRYAKISAYEHTQTVSNATYDLIRSIERIDHRNVWDHYYGPLLRQLLTTDSRFVEDSSYQPYVLRLSIEKPEFVKFEFSMFIPDKN